MLPTPGLDSAEREISSNDDIYDLHPKDKSKYKILLPEKSVFLKLLIYICPKMTKNADFGPNLAVFGPKILIFMGVSKSFGTNITENHLDNLFASFFGQALDQMGQKCRYLAQNASFGPNLAVFGPKIQFLGAGSKNFGTLISGF